MFSRSKLISIFVICHVTKHMFGYSNHMFGHFCNDMCHATKHFMIQLMHVSWFIQTYVWLLCLFVRRHISVRFPNKRGARLYLLMAVTRIACRRNNLPPRPILHHSLWPFQGQRAGGRYENLVWHVLYDKAILRNRFCFHIYFSNAFLNTNLEEVHFCKVP